MSNIEELLKACKNNPDNLESVILRARDKGVKIALPDDVLIFQAKMADRENYPEACRLIIEAHLLMTRFNEKELKKAKIEYSCKLIGLSSTKPE